jgi:anti-sigma B factor antagonist
MDDAVPSLEWTVEPGDRSTVVHVSGEIDLMTQEDFDQAVRAGLDTPSPVVILDLAEVTFLGSIGLRVLVQAHAETAGTERVMRIVDGTEIVRRIMEITGLAQVLALYPTVEQARSA